MSKFTFIDMFCGAGLFSQGWVDAGGQPVLAIDADRGAVQNYNLNVAPVAVTDCVTADRPIPRADVLLAGPPCQGFSSLGRRDPNDERNYLALHCATWAKSCEAKLAIVENVPPFLSSRHWQTMRNAFEIAGYEVSTWVLNAADHNTPQERVRSFTIASKLGELPAPPRKSAAIPSSTVFDRPIPDGDSLHVWGTPSELAARRISLVPPKGDKRDILSAAPHLCPPSWSRVGCQATDVWGRIDASKPANTLRCSFQNPSKGRYLHPTKNRTISLREGARLQGIPDEWNFVGDRYPIARQIGNGVPVPLARAVARSLTTLLC